MIYLRGRVCAPAHVPCYDPASSRIFTPTTITPGAPIRKQTDDLDCVQRYQSSKPLGNSNLILSVIPLREAVQRDKPTGTPRCWPRWASRNRLSGWPKLLHDDASGQRLEDVHFHPA